MSNLVPVSASERLESLDVLRGFALLGILAMNIRAMAATMGTYMYPHALFEYEGASRAAFVFTAVFFDLKMMGLFSMLFGAGVLLYAAKPTATGAPPTGLWYRRMFWLLVIGMVHAYLIWDGDILVPYALCGLLVMWWVRKLSARALLILAIVFLSVGTVFTIGQAMGWDSMPEEDRSEMLEFMMPTDAQTAEQLAAMRGGYVDVVAHRAPTVAMFQLLYFPLFFLWRVGGMMLLGMSLYKSGFLNGSRPDVVYARSAIVCLAIGVGLSSYGLMRIEAVNYAVPERILHDLWNYVGSVFTSVGYASVLLLFVRRGWLAGLRRRLAAVGQMAFSNYLFHSIVTSVIFLGWGFNLVGRLDYAQQLIVVSVIWIFQLIVSPIWLARFRFGPAEWIWRSLTYWQRQPMSRT